MPLFRNNIIPKFKYPLPATINWSSPLAQNLVGAWLFNSGSSLFAGTNGAWSNVYPIENLIDRSDDLLVQNHDSVARIPLWRSTDRGICLDNIGFQIAETLSAPSAALKPTDMVTVFWAGVVEGDGGGSGNTPPLVSMIHNTTISAPFVAYAIARLSSGGNINNKNIQYAYDVGGSFGSQNVNNLISYGVYNSAGLSIKSGTQACYYNGINVANGTASGSLSYGATAAFSCNNYGTANLPWASEKANSSPYVVYVWHRFLTAHEHQLLHLDPLLPIYFRNSKQSSFNTTIIPPIGGTPSDLLLRYLG